MNAPAALGHNAPPNDIDEALAPYSEYIDEAQNWLDGKVVEDEPSMKQVDEILKNVKAAHKAASVAEESATKPLYDVWKAEKARFKPTLDDLDRLKKGLAALVSDFKKRLAAERERERREKEAEARRKAEAAAEAARQAEATDIEAMRAADEAQREAIEAQKAAKSVEKVKGLVTVTKYEVTDERALLYWICREDREAVTAFIHEYARRNHKALGNVDGLRVWQDKVAR